MDDRSRLIAAIADLPMPQQVVLDLRFTKGLPFDAVCAVMRGARGWNEKETQRQMSDAMAALRKIEVAER